MKVFVVGNNISFLRMYMKNGIKCVTSLKDANFVQFTGGEDVTPDMYGEHPHPRTSSNATRDKYESTIFKRAMEKEIPCVGVCRGGQLLNVLNGGKLYQHVDGHTKEHVMYLKDTGETFTVTSTHHQMMRPTSAGDILGTAKIARRKEYVSGKTPITVYNTCEEDVEIVFYPLTQSLCFQPHPEFFDDETRDVFFYLLEKFIF